MKHLALSLLVLLCLAVLAGPADAQAPSANPSYRIGPRDLLEVRVFETQELNVSRRVSEEGRSTSPWSARSPWPG